MAEVGLRCGNAAEVLAGADVDLVGVLVHQIVELVLERAVDQTLRVGDVVVGDVVAVAVQRVVGLGILVVEVVVLLGDG